MHDSAYSLFPEVNVCGARGQSTSLSFYSHACKCAAKRIPLAHHSPLQAVELGEAACLEPRGVRTTSGKLLEAGVVIKAVGFETNAANSRLLGRTHMRSNGLVDRNLWLLVEPHLDKGSFHSPFGSSYLSSVTYGARTMLRYWQNPDLMGVVLAAPLPLVPIDTFTVSDALAGTAALAVVDPAVVAELDEHQKVSLGAYLHVLVGAIALESASAWGVSYAQVHALVGAIALESASAWGVSYAKIHAHAHAHAQHVIRSTCYT